MNLLFKNAPATFLMAVIMALNSKNFAVVFAALIFTVSTAFAQNSVSLEAEIQNIERTITRQGISPTERHEALVRLARLRQLSGDIESAAKHWQEAAEAVPGSTDEDALLAAAYCLAAMGEWDKAIAALEPLLGKSTRARFLDTCIKAIKTGEVSSLAALASNPQFSMMKNEIYFMLWRISLGFNTDDAVTGSAAANNAAAETWRQQLVAEFPNSLEGRIAAGEPSPSIMIRPSPFWFFMSGLDSLPLAQTVTAARPVSQTPSVQPAQSTPPPAPASTVRLQTGLFSRQPNAQAQTEALRKAGFSPSIEPRGEMWAVTVPAGSDQNRVIRELRAAGFESFPVR
jgi:tetratricopeptide (TPR) repeat protein